MKNYVNPDFNIIILKDSNCLKVSLEIEDHVLFEDDFDL